MLRHAHRYPASTLALLLLVLSIGVPASAPAQAPPGPNMVFFENGTIDVVRVYLVGYGATRLLGVVEPGRAMFLQLPPGLDGRSGDELSLVALPVGGSRARGEAPEESPDAIRSVPEPAENLRTMRWRLDGQQLFSVPGRR